MTDPQNHGGSSPATTDGITCRYCDQPISGHTIAEAWTHARANTATDLARYIDELNAARDPARRASAGRRARLRALDRERRRR